MIVACALAQLTMGAKVDLEMAQVLGLFRIEHYKPEASA